MRKRWLEFPCCVACARAGRQETGGTGAAEEPAEKSKGFATGAAAGPACRDVRLFSGGQCRAKRLFPCAFHDEDPLFAGILVIDLEFYIGPMAGNAVDFHFVIFIFSVIENFNGIAFFDLDEF